MSIIKSLFFIQKKLKLKLGRKISRLRSVYKYEIFNEKGEQVAQFAQN